MTRHETQEWKALVEVQNQRASKGNTQDILTITGLMSDKAFLAHVGRYCPEFKESVPTDNYEQMRSYLLGSPSVHFWVKDAIQALDQKDAVDVVHDLTLLRELYTLRIAAGINCRKTGR
uniref:Uncharacterized protein n=1 Tax=viral metagenome TaxID=1070528 RepID=A0A6H1Z9Y6_9ZZZZ